MKKEKNVKKIWTFGGILLVIILIVSTVIIVQNKESVFNNEMLVGKEIKLTNAMKNEIYEKVKENITSSLKSPATAIFPKMKDWNININNSNNVIEVKAYVDSQNSYGAMLRATFEQQYIIIDKAKYLCIYKEFNNETQFDITENAENNKIINKDVSKKQIDDFIKKAGENPYGNLYGKIIDYSFDEKTQQLIWNIKVTSQSAGDLKYYCYLELTSAIDECICIPTVKTNINMYTDEEDKQQIIATVNNLDFEFMIKKWNILCDVGIIGGHFITDFENKLGEKLVQEDIIKNMKVDYWTN